MPQPQPVSPAHRLQLRWGAAVLGVQLALQSYLLWDRMQSGFAVPSDAAFMVILAVGWSLCLGLLIHALWRGPLSRLQTFALYAVPMLLLGLPVAVWWIGPEQATQVQPASEDEMNLFFTLRDIESVAPTLELFHCPTLLKMGFDKQIPSSMWEQLREQERLDKPAVCYGLMMSGDLLSERLPSWAEQTGGKNIEVGEVVQQGNLRGLNLYLELPEDGFSLRRFPVELSAWGIKHVNRTSPLTRAEQTLMDYGFSSFLIVLPSPIDGPVNSSQEPTP